MSTIRETIIDILFYPIPGLSHVPGISHITGMKKLRELQSHARATLYHHRIQEELQSIDIDYALMQDGSMRNQNDREIETRLFGFPVYNQETDQMVTSVPDTAMQPMLEEFIKLERLKHNIRNNLRPAMEKHIEAVLHEIEGSRVRITPRLNDMFKELQQMRLEMLNARTEMMTQRKQTFTMVESYLRGRTLFKRWSSVPSSPTPPNGIPTINVSSLSDSNTSDKIARTQLSEQDMDARIDAQYEKLAELHKSGEELRKTIEKEQQDQYRLVRRRTLKGIAGITLLAATGLAGREGCALYNRHQPYKDTIEHFDRIAIDPRAQADLNYIVPYRNIFRNGPRLDVAAHCVEDKEDDMLHGQTAARIMDYSFKTATDDPKATVDLARVTLHPNTQRSASTPFLKGSFFVERRLREAEQMMTSTNQHHVFSHSIVYDHTYTPGSSAAKSERNFLLNTTCPIVMASGNETSEVNIVDTKSQHIGELSHYPRHCAQIGQAGAQRSFNRPGPSYYVMDGNHPYPFALFTIPKAKLEGEATLLGSSFTAPGFAGNIAAQKSLFPQLSWDNILYASAFGSRRDFFPASNRYTFKTPHNDLSISSDAGFGIIDGAKVELILHNMLYQRTLHPEIKDNPQVIVRDVLENGPPRTTHTITLPPNKDIFKITFDIMPSSKPRNAYIIITDEYKNSKRIKIVDNQPLSRFTDWSLLGTPGSTITVTSDVPIRLGYTAHVNNRGAITLGLNHEKQLLPLPELSKRMNMEKLDALPVAMPQAPTLLNERDAVQYKVR